MAVHADRHPGHDRELTRGKFAAGAGRTSSYRGLADSAPRPMEVASTRKISGRIVRRTPRRRRSPSEGEMQMKKTMTALAALCLVLVVSSGAYAAKGLLTGADIQGRVTRQAPTSRPTRSDRDCSPWERRTRSPAIAAREVPRVWPALPGLNGVAGLDGVAGGKGTNGANGSNGAVGATGGPAVGATGPNGATGPLGTGLVGATGVTGTGTAGAVRPATGVGHRPARTASTGANGGIRSEPGSLVQERPARAALPDQPVSLRVPSARLPSSWLGHHPAGLDRVRGHLGYQLHQRHVGNNRT